MSNLVFRKFAEKGSAYSSIKLPFLKGDLEEFQRVIDNPSLAKPRHGADEHNQGE
jgi:hypothetical protein